MERAQYERVGRLDERFFLYGEDAGSRSAPAARASHR